MASKLTAFNARLLLQPFPPLSPLLPDEFLNFARRHPPRLGHISIRHPFRRAFVLFPLRPRLDATAARTGDTPDESFRDEEREVVFEAGGAEYAAAGSDADARGSALRRETEWTRVRAGRELGRTGLSVVVDEEGRKRYRIGGRCSVGCRSDLPQDKRWLE